MQHTRLPCPSPAPGACSNTCPLSWWCHPTNSSSLILFSSCLQSFPSSGSLPMSQFFALGGQCIGASASASVLTMNSQDWFPLGWTGLISQESPPKAQFKNINSLVPSFPYHPTFTRYMTIGKSIAFTRWTFVGKVMSLLFNMLSRLVTGFLPRSKRLLISWFQSPSAGIFGAQEIKACHCFYYLTIYLSWSDGTGCHDLHSLNVEF